MNVKRTVSWCLVILGGVALACSVYEGVLTMWLSATPTWDVQADRITARHRAALAMGLVALTGVGTGIVGVWKTRRSASAVRG